MNVSSLSCTHKHTHMYTHTLAHTHTHTRTHAHRGVEILKACAKTNQITFIVSRSDKSKTDFRRLSDSLQKGECNQLP